MAASTVKYVTLALVSVIFTKVKEYVTSAIAAIPGLAKASATTLGGIKIGSGLNIDAQGVASVDFSSAKTYADNVGAQVKSDLINGAPEAYDTLKEIADYIKSDGEAAAAMTTQIGQKANSADVYSRTAADSTFMKSADYAEATEAEIVAAANTVFGTAA